ncbi:MAG: hypothetical protein JWP29_1239 [Rhodoferax sp.]|nr:hypothetical protein [Rhodoferax sp.]
MKNSLILMALLSAMTSSAMAQIKAPTPGPTPGLAPGLYVSVTDGQIVLSNKGGTTNFAAGQFGYTASITQPPTVLPKNPGLQFTPPPVFATTSSTPTASGSKAGAVDCEVR